MREVVVAAPTDPASADLAISILAAEGIPARVGGTGVETTWTIGAPTRANPLRVYVAEEHAERARALLGEEAPAPPAATSLASVWIVLALLGAALAFVAAYLLTR